MSIFPSVDASSTPVWVRAAFASRWVVDVDTEAGTITDGDGDAEGSPRFSAGSVVELPGRCVLVLRAVDG